MALYRCEFKIYSRSRGQSAVAGAAYVTGSRQVRGANAGTAGRVSAVKAAAYRSGGTLDDREAGETHDYRAKRDVIWSGILAPDNAPAWAGDRSRLWNEVEQAEKRKDAQLFRECLLTLPRELNRTQQIALVRAYVQDAFVKEGMVADIGIHAPEGSDGREQPHAHVMLTLRDIGPDGFGQKRRDWNDVQWQGKGANTARQDGFLQKRRASWEDYCNAALADAGDAARVDRRSLKARGIDRVPQTKLGKAHHAKPAPWAENIRDNLAGAKFKNQGRALTAAVAAAQRPRSGAALVFDTPPKDPFEAQARQFFRAVQLAAMQPGYRLAQDGIAHAAETARRLHGERLDAPEPSHNPWGHDR